MVTSARWAHVTDLHGPEQVGDLFERLGEVPVVGAQRQVEDLGGGLLGGRGAYVGAVRDGPHLLTLGSSPSRITASSIVARSRATSGPDAVTASAEPMRRLPQSRSRAAVAIIVGGIA